MATHPYLIIQHSDDHGHTWSAEIWRQLVGLDKNYLNRVRLFRQGAPMDRIYRLTFSDPASFTVISANAKIEFGI